MCVYICILYIRLIHISTHTHIYIYVWRNDVIRMMDQLRDLNSRASHAGLSAGLFDEFFSTDASYLDLAGFSMGHHGGTMVNENVTLWQFNSLCY